MTSFQHKKQLRFVIKLGDDSFSYSGTDTIILQGFRASVNIDKAGGMMMGTLRAKIWGVAQEDMNSATTLQWQTGIAIKNTIEVFAIDGETETQVFAGNIVNAWGDYSGMPDVFLNIQAQSAFYSQIAATEPRSYPGGISVATVMGQIATEMGLAFENNGVDAQLSNVYLDNTATEQAKELARMAGCDLYIDDTVLAITPKSGPRGGEIPIISPTSGLVGYPTFDGIGVICKIMFNPAVLFGGQIELVTDIPRAAGKWVVASVAYNLESEKPDGAWFATIRGNQNGLAVTR